MDEYNQNTNPNYSTDNVVDLESAKIKKSITGFIITFVVIIIALFLLNQCYYVVDERDHAIKIRFSEIVEINTNGLSAEEYAKLEADPLYDNVKLTTGAGLKFKIPFIDNIEYFENRLITYDTPAREIITMDTKKLILDNNAQWFISDPYRFKLTMGNIPSANRRIEDLMYSKINEKVGKTIASDLIGNKEYIEAMLIDVADELNLVTDEFGMTVVDVRIKRTDLPEENNANIYNRMITERQQIATQYRSEGREEATKIKAQADKEAQVLVAESYAEAERIKGEGDAEAAAIYNEAYNIDPEFYEFYMSLQTYQSTLSGNTQIVISPDSEFAKYIFSSGDYSVPTQPPISEPAE